MRQEWQIKVKKLKKMFSLKKLVPKLLTRCSRNREKLPVFHNYLVRN